MWQTGVVATGMGIFVYLVVEACISLADFIMHGTMLMQ